MESKDIEHPSISAHSPLTQSTDRITICMYSREAKTAADFHEQMQHERERVERVRQGFIDAASRAGQTPPEFVIAVQLIPDWSRPGNSYLDPEYLVKKAQFMAAAHNNFPRDSFTVHDFYNSDPPLTEDEIKYLEHLDSGGCCLDMLKVKAIITNRDRKHLQLDSNTLIHNYPEFYNTTFSRRVEENLDSTSVGLSDSVVIGVPDVQIDALNAVFYGIDHVSPHSKVVYTKPYGPVGDGLETCYNAYCAKTHEPKEKLHTSNQFYSSVFSKAMRNIGLSIQLDHPTKKRAGGRKAGYSPADLGREEYRITKFVVPAINQEWKEPLPSSTVSRGDIYALSIQIEDIPCDMAVFEYIVRKHTLELIPEDARAQLLAISDVGFDFHIAREFYKFISENHADELPQLIEIIPPTEEGESFKEILIGTSPIPSNSGTSAVGDESDAKLSFGKSRK